MDHPAQLGDVVLFVDRLVFFHHLLQAGEVLHGVFVAPAGLSHQMLRFAPHRAAIEGGGPLADRAGLHHVVAEEWKLVAEAFLQLGQLRVALILQEIHLKPYDGPAFAVEREPRIVHAVLIEVGQDLVGVKRSGGGEQHLVQMRGQPDTGRVPHRIERASSSCLRRSASGAGEKAPKPTDRLR